MRSRDILVVGTILFGLAAPLGAQASAPAEGLADVPAGEEWAVVGVRGAEGPPLPLELAAARDAVAAALGGGGRVLEADELAERLGLRGSTWSEIDELIAEAELYFFQLEAEAARAQLARALRLLGGEVGEEAWERIRTGRLLLAVLHLQAGEEQGALEALLPIAGVQPHLELDEATTPADLQAVWLQAKAQASSRAEGWLRIRCEPSCAGAKVWGEAIPLGPPEASIPLLPGSYRVVVNQRTAGKELRSLPRVVRIRAGEETQVAVNLPLEQGIRTSDGATFPIGGVEARVEQVAGIVAREAGVKGTIAFGAAPDGSLQVWRLDGRGAVVRTAESRDLSKGQRAHVGGDDVASLVEAVFAPGLETGQLVVAPALEERSSAAPLAAAIPSVTHAAPRPSSWEATAKWVSLGATVAISGVATWLTLDAAAGREELRRIEATAGAYRGVEDARRAPALVQSIQEKETWGTALWSGVAVGAVVTTLLFLQDGAASGGE